MTREEAINKVRQMSLPKETMEILQALAPELAESEEERIINAIISFLRMTSLYSSNDCKKPEMIAWLEKQKISKWSPSEDEMGVLYKLCYLSNQITDEDDTKLTRLYQDLKREYFNGHSFENMFPSEKQKPVDNPKWNELTWKDIVELEGIINNVHYDFSAGIGQESFGKEVLERFRSTKGIEYLDEAEQQYWQEDKQKPWEWGEEETKLLDSIIDDYEAAAKSFCGYDGKIGLLRAIRDGEYDLSKQEQHLTVTVNGETIPTENQSVEIPLAEWSEEDSDNLERVDNYLWMLDDYIGDDCAMPQGKTDKIRGNIQGILSPWLKNLPERFNLQPRPEWSKEDEKMRNLAIEWAETMSGQFSFVDMDPTDFRKIATWLKSLRPSWKPSDEQLRPLEYAIDYFKKKRNDTTYLESLYNDLKKL